MYIDIHHLTSKSSVSQVSQSKLENIMNFATLGPSAKVTGLKCSQGVFSSLETENVETREVGDVGDVEEKVESFASKRISRKDAMR